MPEPIRSPFVQQINLALADKFLKDLVAQGFEISHPDHMLFCGKKKGISCSLYTSGKCVVQGKEIQEFIEFYLEPEILQTFSVGYETLQLDKNGRIGVDESGKGDVFGPLCIAGVFAEGAGIDRLHALGVKDSKKLGDPAILKIARNIQKEFAHHIVRINPFKYNELYHQFPNLNHLLAWGHATVIDQLTNVTQCQRVIVDQFANEALIPTALKRKKLQIELTQRHRGEEDIVVAAASILARYAFVEGLAQLGEHYHVVLPKGASAKTIEVGRALVRQFGKEVIPHVAKMHFKTVNTILNIS